VRFGSALNRAIDLHAAVYRATRGRIGQRIRNSPPILLLDHVGARSGRRRTAPLGYIRDGEDIVIVASKGGYPHHPAWYHNLMANPLTTVQIGRSRIPVRARPANPAERDRLWPEVVGAYQGYEAYQRRTDRTIPLIILEPRRRDS
jgi:deazaflavin-dependent oxidoreductase (nitroreductase family)